MHFKKFPFFIFLFICQIALAQIFMISPVKKKSSKTAEVEAATGVGIEVEVSIDMMENQNLGKKIPREFRGAWIATMANIDWPSTRTLSSEQQKAELIKLLDVFQELNLNTVVFQIRPGADAFYNSKYEPWSFYLAGGNDKAPNPYYDPLAFLIEETHKRGMEFHAWLNPYRAVVNYEKDSVKLAQLIKNHPDWFINYDKHKYFNPGVPDVRKYTNKIVADVVQNYDIDAIHFDDYFYPYKTKGKVFPDEVAFKKYGNNFYPNQLEDWRRENVNLIIVELHETIKRIKPWVQFGISPFGVWRNKSKDPKGSDTRAGITNYDGLYADILLWMKNDWIDYVMPQIYWRIGHPKVDYKEIATWWAKNSFNTNLYIGHAVYRLHGKEENEAWKMNTPSELEKQIVLNRGIPEIGGNVFYSANAFLKNPMDINNSLKNGVYQNPTLPPIANKTNKNVPSKVVGVKFEKIKNTKFVLSWQSIPENNENEAVKYLIYQFEKGKNVDIERNANIIAITGNRKIEVAKKGYKRGDVFVIVAVNRNNSVSKPYYFKS